MKQYDPTKFMIELEPRLARGLRRYAVDRSFRLKDAISYIVQQHLQGTKYLREDEGTEAQKEDRDE